MSRALKGYSWDPATKRAVFVRYVRGAKGKARRKRTVTAETEAEAATAWAVFDRELDSPEDWREVPTLATFVEAEWETIALHLRKATARTYRSAIRQHLLPALGQRRVSKITTARVKDFMATLRAKGLAPATVNGAVRVLKVLLHEAVERGAIEYYPVKQRVTLDAVAPLTLELSDDERTRFLAAFDDEVGFRKQLSHRRKQRAPTASRFYRVARPFGDTVDPDGAAAHILFTRFRELRPFFVLALETGLRRGDLHGLRWDQCDLERGWIHIEMMQKTRRRLDIPLSTAACESLEECRRYGVIDPHVFTEPGRGRPIDLGRIIRAFALAKAIAGITRRFRFHDLRHTAACRLVCLGVSLAVISKFLGHTSIRMTERYARVDLRALEEVRDAFNRQARQQLKSPDESSSARRDQPPGAHDQSISFD